MQNDTIEKLKEFTPLEIPKTPEQKAKSLTGFTDKIEGWLTDREGEFLYNAAKNCSGKGVIVEIGSWKGRSTIWLGGGSQAGNNVKVFAIDTHRGNPEHGHLGKNINTFDEFKKNIKDAGIEYLVTPIVKPSIEAEKDWDTPIEMLFIDGCHEYDSVEQDFLKWFRHLVEGGMVVIHDTTACLRTLALNGYRGPKIVADRYIYGSNKVKDVGLVDTITYARKCDNNTPEDRARIRRVRRQKLIPDLKYILLWGGPNLLLPTKVKLALKRLLRPFIKFV